MKPTRKWTLRLLTAAVPVVVLGGLEAAGHAYYWRTHNRTFLWETATAGEKGFMRMDSFGLLWFRPRARVRLLHYANYTADLHTDDLGFIHNGDPSRRFDPSAFNVLFLGGSTVEGRGSSSNAATIPARTESCLRNGAATRVDVYNLGFSGDNTLLESLRIRTRWRELSPSLVISLDGRNDYHAWFVDASVEGTGHPGSVGLDGLYNASGSLAAVGSQIHAWLAIRSAIYKAMSEVVVPDPETYQRRGHSDQVEAAARHYLANHAGTTAWLEGVGTPHAVFFQPTLSVAKPVTADEREMMAAFAAETEGGQAYFDDLARYYGAVSELAAGIPGVYDLSRLFEARSERLYVDSVHYNDVANELIAQEICAAVMRDFGHLLADRS